eukprot:SAG31_NODE_21945_length_537_cov_1.059361_2_plen_22_part_01
MMPSDASPHVLAAKQRRAGIDI